MATVTTNPQTGTSATPATTEHTTTAPASPGGSTARSDSCNIYVPDYTVLRQQNLDKINTYYQSLLGSYTSTYADYAKNSNGTANDKIYANNIALPKYTNYNNQLINITQSVINSVNQDMDLIAAQKDELMTKSRHIDTIMNNLSLLKDKDNEMSVLTGARQQSLSSSEEGLEEINFSNYIFIGVNILFLLIVLGLVFYIVYSSYTTGRATKSMNNLYTNIAANRRF